MSAERALLSQNRWHFQHGPIDLVIGAEGEAAAVAAAHEAAWARFEGLLSELVAELPLLRTPIGAHEDGACPLQGPVARRMWRACRPYGSQFITPMAAVAGSVAEELAECYARPGIVRAWINNGGDIALILAAGGSVRVGLYADLARFDGTAAAQALDPAHRGGLSVDAKFEITHAMPVRGVATSGWRGRSFSLGIADSVTVLAASASEADAAATVIANAVNVQHPGIVRVPASEVQDDSDLGTLRVTREVPPLEPMLVDCALQAGREAAGQCCERGLIHAAVLVCQGRATAVGSVLA